MKPEILGWKWRYQCEDRIFSIDRLIQKGICLWVYVDTYVCSATLSLRGFGNNNLLVSMSTPSIQIMVSSTIFLGKEPWLIGEMANFRTGAEIKVEPVATL